jgi:hypothetical protein
MTGRRAILQRLNGRDVFRKIVLEPGQSLRIGDDDWAHEVISMPYPQGARGIDILWDGLALRADGLGAAPWFYLNGRTVVGGELRNRDYLQIGGLQLRLTLEGWSYPDSMVLTPQAEKARQTLRACPYVYGVLDAARSRRILELLEQSVDAHRSLYEGIEGRSLDHVAPYLVSFEPSSPLLDVLLAEGWGKAWGIYLGGNVAFEYARRHFRRYLMIDHDDGRRLYFRFYDPRALRDFFPVATDWQRHALFAPFETCVYEEATEIPTAIRVDGDQVAYPPPTMTISFSQYQQMADLHRQRLINTITVFLRRDYGAWFTTYDDDNLQSWIDHSLSRAEYYGVHTEPEAIQLLLLWMALGPNAEERFAWFTEILEEPAYEPIGRIRALVDAARRENVPDLDRVILST